VKVDPSIAKDLEWHRKSCVFAWDTIGAWSKLKDQILSQHLFFEYIYKSLLDGMKLTTLVIDPDMKETEMNQVSISQDK
jgi:hypothetical protein